MPRFARVCHLSVACTDLARSVAWWHQVLGLSELDYAEDDGWQAVRMLHDPSATVIELRQPAGAGEAGDASVPVPAPGKLGLEVDSEADLAHWQDFLLRLGVEHSAIPDAAERSGIRFLDPDGLELELFHQKG